MKRVTQFMVILSVIISISWAVSAETIRMTNGEYLPYLSEQLPHYGIWSHLVTEAFAVEGITVEYGFFPWKRALVLVQEGVWDASLGFSKTPEREQTLRFSDTPLSTVTVVFFHRKDVVFDWTTVDDLQGLRIGVQQGYSMAEELEQLKKDGKNLIIEYATTEVQNFKKLLAGRIDIYPVVDVVGMKILRENFTAEEIASLTTHPRPWNEKPLYVVFSQKIPRTDRLHDAFERGFTQLKANGRYDQMLEDFVTGQYDKK